MATAKLFTLTRSGFGRTTSAHINFNHSGEGFSLKFIKETVIDGKVFNS
jgi:hypothetical protein